LVEYLPDDGGISAGWADDCGVIERRALKQLETAAGDTPVVLIHGPRQTGKTTLARQLGGRTYYTFDDLELASAARRDPGGFVASLRGPVVLDEVQLVPEIFRAIKATVDVDRTPGRFVLTGSADVLLLPGLSDSLAGRMEIVPLWPFSQGELLGVRETFIDRAFARTTPKQRTGGGAGTGKAGGAVGAGVRGEKRQKDRAGVVDLAELVLRGSFPEVVARKTESRRTAWFDAYVDTITKRDIAALSQIEGLSEVPRLFEMLAVRTSQLVNTADYSRTLGIANSTLRRYLTLLEMAFMIVPLRAWSNNKGVRLAKAAKLHVVDAGLAAALAKVGPGHLRDDRTFLGPLLETFVAMELTKQRAWSALRPTIMHFRSHAGPEVDLVLEANAGQIVGVEVKASSNVERRDASGLLALAELAGPKFVRGIVLYNGKHLLPLAENIWAWPIQELWAE